MFCGVFKITCNITGDFFIGASKDFDEYWRCITRPSIWHKYPNNLLYQAFENYGVDSFSVEYIEECDEDELVQKKDEYVRKLNPALNMNKHPVLTKQDISQFQHNYNQTHKAEHKARSEAWDADHPGDNAERVRRYREKHGC